MHRRVGRVLLNRGLITMVGFFALSAFAVRSCTFDLGLGEIDLGGIDLDDIDLTGPCEGGSSSLTEAVEAGDTKTVVSLLDEGTDIDREVDEVSALGCAAGNADVEMVRLLLDRGATPTNAAVSELTGLHLFSETPGDARSAETLTLLLDGGAAPDGDPTMPSPLLYSAWLDRPATVAVLLAKGADPDHGGRVSSTLITMAQSPTADALIDDGVDVAVDEAVPEHLLPTPRGELVDDVSPLVGAAWAGNVEVARLLLDAGADPNLAADEAFTPMYAAAVQGDRPMVELLLARGASPTPTVRAGVPSPAEAAREAGHREVAALLTGG